MDSTEIDLIDCDGHLIESLEEMAEFLDPLIRESAFGRSFPGRAFTLSHASLWGTGDGLHYPKIDAIRQGKLRPKERINASDQRMGSADDWVAMLDKTGMRHTVMFPTEGLTVGVLRPPAYAISLCASYNDYIASYYQDRDPRMHPVAMLPMQDPAAAAIELRRAVKELGMLGAFVPAVGLPLHLGHEYYWPVYQEAADLGCVLAVHGGPNRGIGLDSYSQLVASHMLHHPVPLMYAFVSFVYDGVFDKFPDIRWAFLEGGCAWLVLLLDRAERSAEFSVAPNRPFEEYVTSGQVLIGCEGVDTSLPYLAERVGIEPCAYSSDYPHEVDFAAAQNEINETMENPHLSPEKKVAVLGGNARRFYDL